MTPANSASSQPPAQRPKSSPKNQRPNQRPTGLRSRGKLPPEAPAQASSPWEKLPQPGSLPMLSSELLLPQVRGWMSGGAIALLGTLTAAFVSVQFTPYRTTIKAPAVVRPSGELYQIQSEIPGTIADLMVQPYATVKKGDVLLRLDDRDLQLQQQQQQTLLQQLTAQRRQGDLQIQALNLQIQTELAQGSLALNQAQAEQRLSQQRYGEEQIQRQAQFEIAKTDVTVLSDELRRLQGLADAGAIAQQQVRNKQAELQRAQAQLLSLEAQLHPSSASLDIAQTNIAQAQVQVQTRLAQLQQQQQELQQQQSERLAQQQTAMQMLARIEEERERRSLRSPIDGVVQAINLRNAGQTVQPGDLLVEILPKAASLEIQAWVSAEDINQVQLNQAAQVRISACPYTDFGTLPSRVRAIAPDTEPQGDTRAYRVTLEPEQTVLTSGSLTCPIQPGLEGRADIETRQERVSQLILRRLRILEP